MVNEIAAAKGKSRIGARSTRVKTTSATPKLWRRLSGWWDGWRRRWFPRRKKTRRRLGQPGFAAEATQRSAKRSKVFGAGLVIAALAVAIWFTGPRYLWNSLTSLSFVQVSSLRIHGAHVVEMKRIKELAGIVENHSSMLNVNEAEIARRIRADPWVNQVTVSRDWLDMAVDISISENEPMALVNRNGKSGPELWYADVRGNGFLPMKVGQDADYPVISGLDFLSGEEDKREVLATIMGLLKKAARVTKDARQKNLYLTTPTISEILVTPEKKLVLFLVDYPFPIFLGKNTEKQFRYLADALEKLYGDMKIVKIEDIVAIELSYNDDEHIRIVRKIKKEKPLG
jgi:cell division protein FtsQ